MTTAIPTTPDVWLSRKVTAAALTEAGFQTSASTLQTAATRDPSLPFRINGKRAEYRWGTALTWRMAKVRYRGSFAGPDAAQQQAA